MHRLQNKFKYILPKQISDTYVYTTLSIIQWILQTGKSYTNIDCLYNTIVYVHVCYMRTYLDKLASYITAYYLFQLTCVDILNILTRVCFRLSLLSITKHICNNKDHPPLYDVNTVVQVDTRQYYTHIENNYFLYTLYFPLTKTTLKHSQRITQLPQCVYV